MSTRLLSYLFDELRGEYEKFLIRPHSGSPTIRMYVRSPLRRGSRAETRTPAHTMYQPSGYACPQPVRGSERANVLALRMGIFQYNNVLVPTVRRVARMRRHLTSIRITYRYRELYDAYEKSAGDEPSRVQFRWLDASYSFSCTGS